MNKNIKYLLLFLAFISLGAVKVYAKTVTSDEVGAQTYIIGTHMFTREQNTTSGYEGRLTTGLIMLASRTIESGELNDMVIYFKTATGRWINGLNGQTVTPPASFEINYTNLALERENSTVSAPKKPILYTPGPNNIDDASSYFSYTLFVFLDDVENIGDKVDGVELEITDHINNSVSHEDMKYTRDFNTLTTVLPNFTGHADGLYVGKSYHMGSSDIDCAIWGGRKTIAAKAYTKDANGNKVYSDIVILDLNGDTNFPLLTIKNDYSNPDYVSYDGHSYTYRLGIEDIVEYVYRDKPNKFAYALEEKNGSRIGVFALNEKATVVLPEDTTKTYVARLLFKDNNGDFIAADSVTNITGELNEFIIDTRKLTAPVLDGNQEGYVPSELINGGEILKINKSFYDSQAQDTLDYDFEGTEIYEIRYVQQQKKYILVKDAHHQARVFPQLGYGHYVARVYNTDAAGEKVYSDYSNVVTVVHTPEIEVSNIQNGQVNINIVNKDCYTNTFNYKVYVQGSNSTEVLGIFTDNDGSMMVSGVTAGMKIHVRAYATDYYSTDLNHIDTYSAKSNEVTLIEE